MKIAGIETFLLHPGSGKHQGFEGTKRLTKDWEEFPRKGYAPWQPARA